MTDVVFDIETVGPGAKGALSPLTGRITCICYKVHGGALPPICFCGDSEAKIIADFVAAVDQANPTKLIAYVGWAFDVPFVRVRAMLHGIKLPAIFWNDRAIIDPWSILRRGKSGKQVDFAKLFSSDIIGTGFECLDWFSKGDFDKIKEHCGSDIEALDLIYTRMLRAGFVCR